MSERIDALTRAFRKYKSDEAGLILYREATEREIADVEARLLGLASLDADMRRAADSVLAAGRELIRRRSAAARKLESAMALELAELRLGHARLEIACGDPATAVLTPTSGAAGLAETRFLWCANPGHGFTPLSAAASGGELSRLMLALKSILATAHDVPLMVFDEIETGIGPRLGDVIGRRLARLAVDHQVLCVTHLPQIAAFADRHLKIDKKTARGATRLEIAELSGKDRLEELAAMLGGGDPMLARRQAKSLLEAKSVHEQARGELREETRP